MIDLKLLLILTEFTQKVTLLVKLLKENKYDERNDWSKM